MPHGHAKRQTWNVKCLNSHWHWKLTSIKASWVKVRKIGTMKDLTFSKSRGTEAPLGDLIERKLIDWIRMSIDQLTLIKEIWEPWKCHWSVYSALYGDTEIWSVITQVVMQNEWTNCSIGLSEHLKINSNLGSNQVVDSFLLFICLIAASDI